MFVRFGLTFCLVAWISMCKGDDVVVQMFSRTPINVISDKYISYSIDPTELLEMNQENEWAFCFPSFRVYFVFLFFFLDKIRFLERNNFFLSSNYFIKEKVFYIGWWNQDHAIWKSTVTIPTECIWMAIQSIWTHPNYLWSDWEMSTRCWGNFHRYLWNQH